ncbi:MAG: 3-hydroxybutyryl-CoA dehydrogenase [Holosporales bacterium]|nr:3-hydroxybutyryl-CoA dehydrogenase [Holosporales bacterium]
MAKTLSIPTLQPTFSIYADVLGRYIIYRKEGNKPVNNSKKLPNIGLLGCGQMGCGIARAFCNFGFSAIIYDYDTFQLKKGKMLIDQKIAENKIVETIDLSFTNNLEDLETSDLIIECVSEKLETKKQILAKVSRTTKRNCIIATNTSSFLINELALSVAIPERFIGMHFMNPAHMIPLVELIKGDKTSAKVIDFCEKTLALIHKTFVHVKDSPGFILNRTLIPMINEAAFLVHGGIGTVEDIDKAIKLGSNNPTGPLQLADAIGIDTIYSILDSLAMRLKDAKYNPCPLLLEYIEKGWLGRKSSKGFYTYD